MRIDVWSDFACPWCWLGKRHLEEALRRQGVAAEVVLRSFQLDPLRDQTVPVREYLIERYGGEARVEAAHRHLQAMGAQAGLPYDFPRALMANTFDAHRLHHFAKDQGLGAEVAERFFRAQHAEGADLADHGTLVRLAVEVGLDEAQVLEVLASDAFAAPVRQDRAEARALGVGGVPFFVVDRRFALSGAQPVEVFEQALAAATAASAGR